MTQPARQSYPVPPGGSTVAVTSTTATNSGEPENPPTGIPPSLFDLWRSNPLLNPLPEVMCDWLAGVHTFRVPREPRNSGQVMKVSPDGEIEWLAQSWESIQCASSDTSIRIKCDGYRVWFSGNIGRFQGRDNVLGLTVPECVAKWKRILARYGLGDLEFGTQFNVEPMPGIPVSDTWTGDCAKRGTVLTRVDLAVNFWVSCFSDICQVLGGRQIGRHVPILGRYGPTWGYGKRSNWWKGKVYDKTAEQDGKRRSSGGETVARFEVQLGAEFLKRRFLDDCGKWFSGKRRDGVNSGEDGDRGSEDRDMGQIVWAEFGGQVFREVVPERVWGSEMPLKLLEKAELWRAGHDLRIKLKKSQYYVLRRELLAFGIDIGVPCNVQALRPTIQPVQIKFLPALRRSAG